MKKSLIDGTYKMVTSRTDRVNAVVASSADLDLSNKSRLKEIERKKQEKVFDKMIEKARIFHTSQTIKARLCHLANFKSRAEK